MGLIARGQLGRFNDFLPAPQKCKTLFQFALNGFAGAAWPGANPSPMAIRLPFAGQ